MISKKLHKELNLQLKYEFYSSHLYLSYAAYCYSIDLDGFANFFLVQAEEERFHAMKFFNFINEMDQRVTLTELDAPPVDFDSLLDAFEKAMEHEKFVTSRIYHLMDIAMEEREHATISFLKWFIDEQVEEEASFRQIIQKIRRAQNDSNLLYALDAEMAARTFTPPIN